MLSQIDDELTPWHIAKNDSWKELRQEQRRPLVIDEHDSHSSGQHSKKEVTSSNSRFRINLRR